MLSMLKFYEQDMPLQIDQLKVQNVYMVCLNIPCARVVLFLHLGVHEMVGTIFTVQC